jgi:cytochrome c2
MKKKTFTLFAAASSLIAFVSLLYVHYGWPVGNEPSATRGEEVYTSHDCTDCHLSAPVLRQKREKREPGLIRVRKEIAELLQFLQTDKRHETYSLISPADRADLIEYLKSLDY